MKKTYLDQNVYDAALERLRAVFDEFGRAVTVSFSGGKDSTVLLHMALLVAEEKNLLPLKTLFIDLEGQYSETIRHVCEMMDDPRVDGTWICLPLNLRNAVSHFQPHWACWDEAERENWVRPLPDHPSVISDVNHFPFFRHRMEFEEFVPEYEMWLAKQMGVEKLCCLVGIRSDESLNRFRTIVRENVGRYSDGGGNDWKWSSMKQGKGAKNTPKKAQNDPSIVNAYPLYDWRVEDIWIALGRNKWAYNRLYDWMYLHGTSLHDMRICQPYGDDQRVGLDQFHAIEPETWHRILQRVLGVNSGALYARQKFMGYGRGYGLPEGHTWKSYTKLLLNSLPPDVAAHYREKFLGFMLWWKNHRRSRGYKGIFDAGIKNPQTGKNIPSWQRMAECILKNDYWCHSLKFGQTKRIHEKQQALREKYRDL